MLKRWKSRAVAFLVGVIEATGMKVVPMTTNAGRYAGVRIEWRPAEAGVLRGAIREFEKGGVKFRFFIVDESDTVQRCHHQGNFYEEDELALMRPHFSGGVFVDVGANVGNHAIYSARIFEAARVIAFEPDPLAADICEINARLNACDDRIVLHRIGLSDRPARARAIREEHNLGGTRLEIGDIGSIEIATGDRLLAHDPVSFIKIDTEGHELGVLAGLQATIRRNRPALFVEVTNENIEAFENFCSRIGYQIIGCFRRYDVCTNFLALPAQASDQATGRRARTATITG